MRFAILIKATKDSEAGVMPSQQLLTDMASSMKNWPRQASCSQAKGLHPSSKGARIRFSGNNRTVIDGPFAETKELIAGFWLWEVNPGKKLSSGSRCPNPMMEDSESRFARSSTRRILATPDTGDSRERAAPSRPTRGEEVAAACAETGWNGVMFGSVIDGHPSDDRRHLAA